ncbi:MAG: hypothetical protein S4CHLAM37_12500 [Chlamydiia bacterium]|nr:hypothetical protein [Chlamydiia bacterium]
MSVHIPVVTHLRNQQCTVCKEPLRRAATEELSSVLDQITKCGHVFHRECLAQDLKEQQGEKIAPVMAGDCPQTGCKQKVLFMFAGPGKLRYNRDPMHPSLVDNQVASLEIDIEREAAADAGEVVSITRDAQPVKLAAYALTAIAVASFSVAFLSTFTAFSIAAALFTVAAMSESRAINWYLQVQENSFQVIPRAE